MIRILLFIYWFWYSTWTYRYYYGDFESAVSSKRFIFEGISQLVFCFACPSLVMLYQSNYIYTNKWCKVMILCGLLRFVSFALAYNEVKEHNIFYTVSVFIICIYIIIEKAFLKNNDVSSYI